MISSALHAKLRSTPAFFPASQIPVRFFSQECDAGAVETTQQLQEYTIQQDNWRFLLVHVSQIEARCTRPSTMLALLAPILSLSLTTNAHFLLNYPPTIGFNSTTEGLAPCGGFPIIFNNMTAPTLNITVGGFPIELQSTHPQANWLFRATLSQSAPFNWSNLLPVVSETGIGEFCVPDLSTPLDFAGRAGIVQVVQMADDGVAYQVGAVTSLEIRRAPSADILSCRSAPSSTSCRV